MTDWTAGLNPSTPIPFPCKTHTGIIMVVLIYNTQFLYWIPYCTLGAVIVSAMLNLVNLTGACPRRRVACSVGHGACARHAVGALGALADWRARRASTHAAEERRL